MRAPALHGDEVDTEFLVASSRRRHHLEPATTRLDDVPPARFPCRSSRRVAGPCGSGFTPRPAGASTSVSMRVAVAPRSPASRGCAPCPAVALATSPAGHGRLELALVTLPSAARGCPRWCPGRRHGRRGSRRCSRPGEPPQAHGQARLLHLRPFARPDVRLFSGPGSGLASANDRVVDTLQVVVDLAVVAKFVQQRGDDAVPGTAARRQRLA